MSQGQNVKVQFSVNLGDTISQIVTDAERQRVVVLHAQTY